MIFERRERRIDKRLLDFVRWPVGGYSTSRELKIDWQPDLEDWRAKSFDENWRNQRKVFSRREFISDSDTERFTKLAEVIRHNQRNSLNEVVDSLIAKGRTSVEDFFGDNRISSSSFIGSQFALTPQDFPKEGEWKFTVSCLAPKAQNPNKSDQSLPDLAELALLIHFEELANIAEERYGKKVSFKLLTEGHYSENLLGFDKDTVYALDRRIKFFSNEIVQNKKVTLEDWYDGVIKLSGYQETYERYVQEITEAWNKYDGRSGQLLEEGSFEDAIIREFPTVYQTIKPADSEHLRQIYGLRRGRATHQHIQASMEATIRLVAFNRARKELGERKLLYQGYIYGSLTPGKDKFAFYAIGPDAGRYPNHGVGILNIDTGEVEVKQVKNVRETRRGNHMRTVS